MAPNLFFLAKPLFRAPSFGRTCAPLCSAELAAPVARLNIMGRFPPSIARRIVYHADWRFLHWARPDPHFPRTEQVRWVALQNRLYEFGSVAGLLGLKGYTLRRRWRGRHGKTVSAAARRKFLPFGTPVGCPARILEFTCAGIRR
jgi:hypothetical protein